MRNAGELFKYIAIAVLGVVVTIGSIYTIVRDPKQPDSQFVDPTQAASTASSQPGTPAVAYMFGDSYFNGTDYSSPEQSMAAVAAAQLGDTLVLGGAGGTGFTAANAAANIPNYLDQIAAGAFDKVAEPSLVVIEGGLNDRKADPGSIQTGAATVLDEAHSKFPGALIVLVGPVDPDGDLADTKPVVTALSQAAEGQAVPFIDASRWLKGHYDLIGPDGIHPNPDGSTILGDQLAAALAALA